MNKYFNSTIVSTNGVRTVEAKGTGTTYGGISNNANPINPFAAGLIDMKGIIIDQVNNIYVCHNSFNLIRKISPSGTVEIFAGSSSYSSGSSNGTKTDARFNFPYGIATDIGGTLYITDGNNATIRKMTSTGVVTTFAGTSGSAGFSSTQFNDPKGIAVDINNNVYVADSSNHAIRKISSAGIVTTLAGTNTPGTANGNGTAARFNYPYGVTVDLSGNVYVADTYNYTIRKVTASGVVTTLAGLSSVRGATDGTGTAATFSYSYGVTVDSSGNVYVADNGNHTIRKVTSAGVVTTLAGLASNQGFVNGTGIAARFSDITALSIDSTGNLYATDSYYIRKITPAGVVTTIAGKDMGGSNFSLIDVPFTTNWNTPSIYSTYYGTKSFLTQSTVTVPGSGILLLDVTLGTVFNVSLVDNTVFVFGGLTSDIASKTIKLITIGSSATKTITFPSNVKWTNAGAGYTTSVATLNKADIYTFTTTDNGNSWLGIREGTNI